MAQPAPIVPAFPKASPETLRRLVDRLPALYFELTVDGDILYANPSAALAAGYSLDEMVGQDWVRLLYSPAEQAAGRAFFAGLQSDEVAGVPLTLLTRHGEPLLVDVTTTNVITEGQVERITVMGVQLAAGQPAFNWTGRGLTRKQRSDQQAYQAFLLENIHDAIVATDAGLRVTAWNRTAEEIYGWSQAEALDRLAQDILRSEVSPEEAARIAAALKDNGHFRGELVQYHRDGHAFTVDMRASALYDENHVVTGYIVVSRDISERKQTETALREKNNLIMTAANGLPITLFLLDRDGTLRVSLGKSVARQRLNVEPVGRSIYDLYRDVPAAIENFHRALAGETFEAVIEISSRLYEMHYTPLQNENDEITGVAGVALDITQRKMAEEALHDSQTRFRIIFEFSEIGIDLLDLTGRFITANPALHKMLGYTSEELSALTVTDITHPADAAYSLPFFHDLAAGRRETYRVEKRYIRKDGGTVWAFVTTSLVRGSNGEPQFALTMVENITDRKLMQAELEEVQRRLMDSAEAERLHLAQELHDGPVQDLYGLVYVIEELRSQVQAPPVNDQLASMKSMIQKVTGELRNTARDLRPPALAPFGLEKAIISHADQFAQENPHIHIDLNLTPDGQLLPERVRLALFRIYQQALVNVKRHAEATQVEVRFDLDIEQVILEIKDNGKGFDVPRGWITLVRGGHFGLAGSAERAEAIGGKLIVQSQPGQGALIRVTLPFPEEDL